MESKEGTAALQTEEGIRRKIKKAVMDFQVGIQIPIFCGFRNIDYVPPGICWSEPDRSCGWKDTGNDGDTKVKIDLRPYQLGIHYDAGQYPLPNSMQTLMCLTQSDKEDRYTDIDYRLQTH